jgi:type IV secretory pathway protease TraF
VRKAPLAITICLSVLCLGSLGISLKPKLVWNRTDSAPRGLYCVNDADFVVGDWVVLSPESGPVLWIADHGFIGPDWPVIKRVAALKDAQICRQQETVSIDGKLVAIAKSMTAAGVELPVWQGCRTLGGDDVFLLGDHENSLDGRYFGAVHRQDLDGRAHLVWSWRGNDTSQRIDPDATE